MSKNGNDILSNVLMFTFRNDYISAGDIIHRFRLSIETTDKILQTLHASGIIGDINENNNYPVIVKSIDVINEGIIEFLNESGFTNNEIIDSLKSLKTEEKEEVSIILNEKRDWKDINDVKPEEGVPVAVRLLNRNMIYTENKTEVLYGEDVKICHLSNDKWSVTPPYPKYDYSPLTKFGELKDGTVVTHWAELNDGELKGWKNRFNRIYGYKLKIEVDPDWEERVYRALMWGAAYISKFGGPDFINDNDDNDLYKLYNTLCDMQACIDGNIDGNNIEIENYRKLIKLANHIVKNASEESSNGAFEFTFADIVKETSKEWLNDHINDIKNELSLRDEITDVYIDYADSLILISIDPSYCINYEWEDGDEEIFECSKEEWEQKPKLEVKLKGVE